MKLENQVVSLKYAKKLKELGFKQESIWYWVRDKKDKDIESSYELWRGADLKPWEVYEVVCSAHTVAELGEMLPFNYIVLKHISMPIWFGVKFFMGGKAENIKDKTDKTEANARAKMLIYLKENKLIEGGQYETNSTDTKRRRPKH